MMARRLLLLLLVLTWLHAGDLRAARIVAIGDVHGEPDGFDSVLRAAALIDQEGRWVGGDAILVQTGDLTDRGARVRDVIDRMRSLEEQAPAEGGRVVALLGNHEVNNLTHLFDEHSTPAKIYHQIWSDFAGADAKKRQKAAHSQWYRWQFRYPRCVKDENHSWIADRAAWLEAHPPGFAEYIEAFSPTGEYGRWLRGLGIAVEIEGTIFLHGGLSPQLVERGVRSVAAINEAAGKAIEQFDRDRKRLVDEQVIVPISTLWETHCAVSVEMARLEKKGKAKALARRSELEEIKARLPGMPGWFPTEESGPLWYRGLATAEEADLAPQLDGVLTAFGADRIAVGHTPQPGEIRARFGGRVYLLDTAMAYPELGGRAAALEIDGDLVSAIYPNERVRLTDASDGAPAAPDVKMAMPEPVESTDGLPDEPVESTNGHADEPVESTNGHADESVESTNGHADEPVESTNGQTDAPVEATNGHQDPATTESTEVAAEPSTSDADIGPRPVWLAPDGQPLPFTDVAEVLEFLAKAKVVESTNVGTGVTHPRKLQLEHNGVRAHAIFHNVAIEKRRERLSGGTVVNFFRDHYANNVAAFELSRMLGLTNVPPAVIRRVGRETGSVQLWIEGSNTETERRRQGLDPDGTWRLTAKDMQVFDNLTNNIDRNQGNILYDRDWNLWFIDHTRTFGRVKQLPSPERVRRCSRRLRQALQDLDEAEVRQRLRPYIGIYEIRGLMARRDLLLDLLDERMATSGEIAVLFDYDAATAAAESEPEVPEAPAEPETESGR